MVAFVGGRPSVLVLAIDEIDYTQFRTLMSKAGVRYIVDLRSSPSFYGRGFRREAVEALLRQNGIAYTWLPDLLGRWRHAASHLQAGGPPRLSFSAEELGQLRTIRQMIDRGPVLVIDRNVGQSRQTIDAFLDGLTGIRPGFSVAMVGSGTACHVAYSPIEVP
jgi:hypothetical protein